MNILAIPRRVVDLLTFPGVVFHEAAQQLICRWLRIAMGEVCYFRFGTPPGFVNHESPANLRQVLLIGLCPFFLNSLLGVLIALPAILAVQKLRVTTAMGDFLAWLGVSIAMYSFPYAEEADELWHAIWSSKCSTLTRVIAAPLVRFVYVGARCRFIMLDPLYGIVLVVILPALLVHFLS